MGDCQSCFKNENEIIIQTDRKAEVKLEEGILYLKIIFLQQKIILMKNMIKQFILEKLEWKDI